jgi:hypothetical protein
MDNSRVIYIPLHSPEPETNSLVVPGEFIVNEDTGEILYSKPDGSGLVSTKISLEELVATLPQSGQTDENGELIFPALLSYDDWLLIQNAATSDNAVLTGMPTAPDLETLDKTDATAKLATTNFVQRQFFDTYLQGSPVADTPSIAASGLEVANAEWVIAYFETQRIDLADVAGGYAKIDESTGRISSSILPNLEFGNVEVVTGIAEMLALSDTIALRNGDMVVVVEASTTYILKNQDSPDIISSWVEMLTPGVTVENVANAIGGSVSNTDIIVDPGYF